MLIKLYYKELLAIINNEKKRFKYFESFQKNEDDFRQNEI